MADPIPRAMGERDFPGNWSVYNDRGVYVGCFVHVEDAAVLVASLGDGTTIRNRLRGLLVQWLEGDEAIQAAESFDRVATIVHERDRRGGGR